MFLQKPRFWCLLRGAIFCAAMLILPASAHAAWGIVDYLDLSPFVPLVLDTMMAVATGAYDFFVGRGNGPIYLLVYGFVGLTIGLYLIKMYFPKSWLGFFGFSSGGDMWDAKTTGTTIAENVARPVVRGMIAVLVLLQIRPVYITEWLINPFLQFGALYTEKISAAVATTPAPAVECPPDIVQKAWISKSSCEFLVQPVSDLTHANNGMIKRGFDFINRGIRGLVTLIPHGGEDFLNIISGILIVVTFVGLNLFMALLIIQAIFSFGMALILYPFNVLTWVAKPKRPNEWFDIWPPFEGIVNAMQKLIITMIACAFILCINVAVIRALFSWNSSVFVAAAGGAAGSNLPVAGDGGMLGFGQHSILWLSSILTFYLMFQIFNRTRAQLNKYAPGMDKMYKDVTSDAKTLSASIKKWGTGVGQAMGIVKKK